MTEIQITISDLTGIEADIIRIRVNTNDDNEVVRIIVIVDDERTVEIISKTINTEVDNCQTVRSEDEV